VLYECALLNDFSHMSTSLLNSFLASVAQFKNSDTLAKQDRSASCWLADLLDVPKPVNTKTIRLVEAISHSYKVGNKVLLSDADISKLSASSSSGLSPPRALLLVLAYTGLRPSSLHLLSAASVHSGKLFCHHAKGFPVGFNLFVSPILAPVLDALARHFGSKHWYIHNKAASDLLPSVSLRSLRVYYASSLYSKKVSSAFIMRQLNHSMWATSCTYIVSGSFVSPPWVPSCSASPSDPFVPSEAFNSVYSHPDPAKFSSWLSSWRSSFGLPRLDPVLHDDDPDVCDPDSQFPGL